MLWLNSGRPAPSPAWSASREIPNRALHDHGLALDIEHNFGTGLEIEPLADVFGNHNLQFEKQPARLVLQSRATASLTPGASFYT